MAKKEDKFDKNRALDFEASKKDLITKSNTRAWTVAIISVIITLLLALAIFFMLPLKTVELRVIKVDKNGFIDVVDELKEKYISTSEATDKGNIAQYVKFREQYYYDTLANDYTAVQIMSNDIVTQDYLKIYDGKNGRAEQLQDRFSVSVKILSIVLTNSNGTKVATVRAEVTKKDKSTNSEIEKSVKVLTLSYEYLPLKQEEKSLYINPLGFTVTSYRKDREVRE